MIERTPILNVLTHVILISGLVMILVPIWLAFVAATHTLQAVNSAPEFMMGRQLIGNRKAISREKLANTAISMKEVVA